MREIALHILDLARNSIEAGASEIRLCVLEDRSADLLQVTLADNGRGMDADTVAQACDAFHTSRTTRRVGLGLPLFKATCERCGGSLEIVSHVGVGTRVVARLQLGHLDRPPLGDVAAVIQSLACEAERTALSYRHQVNGHNFELDTARLQRELGDISLATPVVLQWLADEVREGLRDIGSQA